MKTIHFLSLATFLVSFCGCYMPHKSKSHSPAYVSDVNFGNDKLVSAGNLNSDIIKDQIEAGNVNMPVKEMKRKVVFSGYMTLLVKRPDSTSAQLQRIAKEFDGYVSETGTNRVVLRVKSDHFNSAMKAIEPLGKVDYRRVNGQDVTDDYLDMKIRLENAEHARNRYLELLAKAENVEAALKVEKELERLNGTIDQLKGKMARLDHLEMYSTITVTIKEKVKPGLLGYIGMGLWKSFKWLFVRN